LALPNLRGTAFQRLNIYSLISNLFLRFALFPFIFIYISIHNGVYAQRSIHAYFFRVLSTIFKEVIEKIPSCLDLVAKKLIVRGEKVSD
jgi:hypothetical protein